LNPPPEPAQLIKDVFHIRIFPSNRNPLHNIPGHASAPAIANLRGPRVRVPGEVLNVLGGHVPIEEIGHDGDPEAVRGEEVRQARMQETPLHHLPHGVRRVPHLPGHLLPPFRASISYSPFVRRVAQTWFCDVCDWDEVRHVSGPAAAPPPAARFASNTAGRRIGGGGGVKHRVEGQLGGVQEAVAQSARLNNNLYWLQFERAGLSLGAALKVSLLRRHPQGSEARDRGAQENI